MHLFLISAVEVYSGQLYTQSWSGSHGMEKNTLPLLGIEPPFGLPWLRWLVTCLSLRRLRFDRRPIHVGFVVDRVALGQFSPVSIIPLMLPSTSCSVST
jgi:hypothetical protein